MPHRIRIPVHHEKCILATRDDQVLRVVARSRRRFEEVAVARLLLEILHSPWSPESLKFLLWKLFVRHFRIASTVGKADTFRFARVVSSAAKSSQHFCRFPVSPGGNGLSLVEKRRTNHLLASQIMTQNNDPASGPVQDGPV